MVNSSLTPRRVVTAVGLVLLVSLSGCSTPGPSSTSASQGASSSASKSVASTDKTTPSRVDADVYARRIEEFEASYANRNSHVRRVFYADALMHTGEPRKAIQVLNDTEIAFPDAYINALYLGLAYEMVGDLRSARLWVSRCIERNIDARSGTEWLHLAMLEARLALAKDPEWLKSHTVLDNNTHRTAEEILGAIRIQLAVRGDLGMKPDAVVSDLYFEAGICTTSLSARQEYFAQSLEISALRLSEIERQEKVRARAHASAQLH